MGLFSFIKGAGTKLFGKKKEDAEAEKTAEVSKIQSLIDEINRLGIPVSNLTVDLGTQVIVGGQTMTNGGITPKNGRKIWKARNSTQATMTLDSGS